jgi:hypothetical protein
VTRQQAAAEAENVKLHALIGTLQDKGADVNHSPLWKNRCQSTANG